MTDLPLFFAERSKLFNMRTTVAKRDMEKNLNSRNYNRYSQY